jgi:hypothetical protein
MFQNFGVAAAFGCATHTITNPVKSQRYATNTSLVDFVRDGSSGGERVWLLQRLK